MKINIIKYSKIPFIRNVIIMSTGTAAAQLINIVLAPIITRFYGPEAFGVLGVFTAVVGIISPVAALTFPVAIVLPKSNNEAKGLIRLSIYISVIISLTLALFLTIFNESIVNLFNIKEISPFLYLIPIIVFFSGLEQVIEQWLIRLKQFKVTANVTFLHSLILQGSKVGIGLFYPIAAMLIIATVFGQFMKALMLYLGTKKLSYKSKKLAEINEDLKSIKVLAKEYKDFPAYRAPEVFINGLSQGLPIMMLTSFFGPASVGLYTIGRTVLGIPSQLIGKSVGDVFYPRISEAANNGENLTKLIKKATLFLGAIGIIPYGIVIIFGPWLFSLVFGEDWIRAGEYARWIAVWSLFAFMNRPSVKALPVLNAQLFQLKFTIFMLIVRIAFLALGYYLFSSDLVAIALFSLSGALLNICLILLTLRKSRNFDENYKNNVE